MLLGNRADRGGGASYSVLNGCTVVGNSATDYGGADSCAVTNSIVYYNSALLNNANHGWSSIGFCCTTPLPSGPGNLSDGPLFLNTNGWADLRLQSISPCLNAGDNSCVTWGTDLAGQRRVVDGTIDIGAYERQPVSSGLAAVLGLTLSPGQGPLLTLQGVPGHTYRIEHSPDLEPPPWAVLTNLTLTTNLQQFTDPQPPDACSRRLYRAVADP